MNEAESFQKRQMHFYKKGVHFVDDFLCEHWKLAVHFHQLMPLLGNPIIDLSITKNRTEKKNRKIKETGRKGVVGSVVYTESVLSCFPGKSRGTYWNNEVI